MQTRRRSLLLGLAALALAGCTSTKPSLYHVQASNVDLQSYRTFAFFPSPPSANSPLIHRRLLEAAQRELERRGYAFDLREPDLLVNVGAVIQERQALRSAPGPYAGVGRVETEDYMQGVLTVDLVDVQRRELIWQGAAKGRVGDAMLRDVGAAADKAMAEIFEGFPVQSGGRPAKNTQGV